MRATCTADSLDSGCPAVLGREKSGSRHCSLPSGLRTTRTSAGRETWGPCHSRPPRTDGDASSNGDGAAALRDSECLEWETRPGTLWTLRNKGRVRRKCLALLEGRGWGGAATDRSRNASALLSHRRPQTSAAAQQKHPTQKWRRDGQGPPSSGNDSVSRRSSPR